MDTAKSPIQPGDIVQFTPEFIKWKYAGRHQKFGQSWRGRVWKVSWDELNGDYVAAVQDQVGGFDIGRIGVDKLILVKRETAADREKARAFSKERHDAAAAFNKEFGLEDRRERLSRLGKRIAGGTMKTNFKSRLETLAARSAKLRKRNVQEVLTMVCPKCRGGGIFEGKVCPRCKGQRTVLSANLSDLRERLAKLKKPVRTEVLTMVCPKCRGGGMVEGKVCPRCKGQRTVLSSTLSDLRERLNKLGKSRVEAVTMICPECKGSGLKEGKLCPKCNGKMTVLEGKKPATEMKRVEGRRGTATEYVEFQAVSPSGVKRNFVAQKGNEGRWFIFGVEPGRDGAVRTLRSFPFETEKEEAADYAKQLAQRWEAGKLTDSKVISRRRLSELTNICPECKGSGFVGGKTCPKCKGTRAYSEPENRVWGESLAKLRVRLAGLGQKK